MILRASPLAAVALCLGLSAPRSVAVVAAVAVPAVAAVAGQSMGEQATYLVQLRAYQTGDFVDSKDITVEATSQAEFIRAVVKAQEDWGRELNARKVKWNTIDYVFR